MQTFLGPVCVKSPIRTSTLCKPYFSLLRPHPNFSGPHQSLFWLQAPSGTPNASSDLSMAPTYPKPAITSLVIRRSQSTIWDYQGTIWASRSPFQASQDYPSLSRPILSLQRLHPSLQRLNLSLKKALSWVWEPERRINGWTYGQTYKISPLSSTKQPLWVWRQKKASFEIYFSKRSVKKSLSPWESYSLQGPSEHF